MFHQDKFGIKNSFSPEEFGYCSIWVDSLEQYVYSVGLLMYEDLGNIKDTVSLKISELTK